MISFSIAVLFFAVIDETVNVTSRSDTGVCFPGIWTDNIPKDKQIDNILSEFIKKGDVIIEEKCMEI